MHHFILLVTWITSGGCWPMSEAEHKLDLITARDLQAVGAPTTNGSTITARTVTLAKEINTTLALLMFLLTIGSYLFLMRHTPTLSDEIILPSKLLGDNIAAVLSLSWPRHPIGSPNEKSSLDPKKLLLCYKWPIEIDGRLEQESLDFDDFKEQPTTVEMGKSHMVVVKAFSPVMKSLVQIAIWNHVSLWLVFVMIVNTLVYNGFLSHSITYGSVLRLVLVGVYAVASMGHSYHTTTLLYRNFTYVLFQTCWTIICKKFVFESSGADSLDIVWSSFNFELLGRIEFLDALQYPTIDNSLTCSPLPAWDNFRSKNNKSVEPICEAEIKAYEKATELAVEKVLANVAVLLAICLATALAPWNSTQTISATSAQLGSYALLFSISAGFWALISSTTQLMNATGSAKTLLLLQEKTIAAVRDYEETGNASNKFWLRDPPSFSLSNNIEGTSQFKLCSLRQSMSLLEKFPCILLGPALMLIPRKHRVKHPAYGSDFLTVKVHGVQLICWTIGDKFGHINRAVPSPDGETRQQRANVHVDATQEGVKNYAAGLNEDDNIIKHQQENPGTSGNSDTSDAHE